MEEKKSLERAPVQWPSARDGGRRIGACSDFAWPSGTLWPSARSILPSRGGWCGGRRGGHRIELLLFSLPLAWRLTGAGASPHGHPGERVAKRNARKEELVKCVLAPRFSSAPAPRESAIKPVPHPAAPVGQSPQTRRHHLTPTPVQRGGTKVPERGQKRFFLLDRPRPVLFLSRTKREWGVE